LFIRVWLIIRRCYIQISSLIVKGINQGTNGPRSSAIENSDISRGISQVHSVKIVYIDWVKQVKDSKPVLMSSCDCILLLLNCLDLNLIKEKALQYASKLRHTSLKCKMFNTGMQGKCQ